MKRVFFSRNKSAYFRVQISADGPDRTRGAAGRCYVARRKWIETTRSADRSIHGCARGLVVFTYSLDLGVLLPFRNGNVFYRVTVNRRTLSYENSSTASNYLPVERETCGNSLSIGLFCFSGFGSFRFT